jgi:putative endopeptidase
LLASAATLSLAAAAPAFGAATAAQNTAAKSTKPMLGTWGVDLRGMDKSVKPGENFFNYANGTWDKTVQIPSDRPSWGSFDELGELSRTRTRTIIEESAKTKGAPGSNQQKVGDMYASFMDEAAIERAGIAPLKPWLAKVNSIRTKSDLAR